MDIALIIDIILAAIFAACVYTGAKNGFVRAVASLLASVVALGATMFVVVNYAPVVSEQIVNPWIETQLEKHLEENMDESALETVDSLISTAQKIFVSIGDLMETEEGSDTADTETGDTTADASETEEENEADTAKELVGSIAAAVGNVSTAILMFLILFALFLAILRVLIDQLRFINKIPIVGPMNILLGALLGAVTGVIVLVIPVWAIVNFVPSLFEVSSVVDQSVLEQSRIIALILKYVK